MRTTGLEPVTSGWKPDILPLKLCQHLYFLLVTLLYDITKPINPNISNNIQNPEYKSKGKTTKNQLKLIKPISFKANITMNVPTASHLKASNTNLPPNYNIHIYICQVKF